MVIVCQCRVDQIMKDFVVVVVVVVVVVIL